MAKEIQIQLTKCLLILYENEVWKLPPEILTKAIKRGKGYRRAEAVEKQQKGAIKNNCSQAGH